MECIVSPHPFSALQIRLKLFWLILSSLFSFRNTVSYIVSLTSPDGILNILYSCNLSEMSNLYCELGSDKQLPELFLPLPIKYPGGTTKACGSGVSSLTALKVARKLPLLLLQTSFSVQQRLQNLFYYSVCFLEWMFYLSDP